MILLIKIWDGKLRFCWRKVWQLLPCQIIVKIALKFERSNKSFHCLWIRIYSWDLNTEFKLKDSLHRAVKLPRNTDPAKYSYSEYDVGFDLRLLFINSDFDLGKKFVTFGAHNS